MRAIENPIMHKYAKTLIGGVQQSQSYSAVDVWPHRAESYLPMVGRIKAIGTNKQRQRRNDATA
ncbi:hypothetical protein AB3538_00650 [Acinetobacter baumannii]